MLTQQDLRFSDWSIRCKYLLTLWGLVYHFCVGYPPWRGVDVPFPIPPNSCSSLNRIGSEFLIRPDIGSPFAKRFSATLLTHPEVNHHTGRGCNPTVRECYFLLFLLDYEYEILSVFQVLDFDQNSYRLQSRKVLDYDLSSSRL